MSRWRGGKNHRYCIDLRGKQIHWTINLNVWGLQYRWHNDAAAVVEIDLTPRKPVTAAAAAASGSDRKDRHDTTWNVPTPTTIIDIARFHVLGQLEGLRNDPWVVSLVCCPLGYVP